MSETVSPVELTIDAGIATLRMASPPVNALGHAVRLGIMEALAKVEKDDTVQAVILTGTDRFFSAGADIKEFGKARIAPLLGDVIARIESYHVPIVAAISGKALGGGLELALACHIRLALKEAQLGLPEVTLGLIPGAGGTQRLPRLVGHEAAATMICYGKPVSASAAFKIGFVDDLVRDDVVEGAVRFISDKVLTQAKDACLRPVSDRSVPASKNPNWEAPFRKALNKKSRGQAAPEKALEAVLTAGTVPFSDGLAKERELFQNRMIHPDRAALTHAFSAERAASKISGVVGLTQDSVGNIAILGAGTMGVGITIACLVSGYSVQLFDIDAMALDRARDRIVATLERNVETGRMDRTSFDAAKNRLRFETQMEALSEADLVIEAVVERMDVKQSVFQSLGKIVRPTTILASNTSYLDIDEIASVTPHPERVIGLHFFSPAHIMKLLEVIDAEATAPQTLATALSVAKNIKKIPVVAKICDGFIGNRIFKTYRRQAEYLVADGALPQDVDRVLTEFGFAMGPFAVSDLAGLDIGWHTRRREDATRLVEQRYVDLADRLYDLGRLGRKTGAGWYRYETGSTQPIVDPEVTALIEAASAEAGQARTPLDDATIRDRILFAMINEAAKILDEGVAAKASDIDVVYLHGYGFPRHQGGPMFYADRVGVKAILARIQEFAREDPHAWSPADLLVTLAESDGDFLSYQVS